MTNVVKFPGITTLGVDADGVLESAKGELEDVLVLGFDKDGDFYFAGSNSDAGDALYLMEMAKFQLMKICNGEDE